MPKKPRPLSSLDLRALEIRRLAAKEADLVGIEALALIVWPTRDVEEASRLVAAAELQR